MARFENERFLADIPRRRRNWRPSSHDLRVACGTVFISCWPSRRARGVGVPERDECCIRRDRGVLQHDDRRVCRGCLVAGPPVSFDAGVLDRVTCRCCCPLFLLCFAQFLEIAISWLQCSDCFEACENRDADGSVGLCLRLPIRADPEQTTSRLLLPSAPGGGSNCPREMFVALEGRLIFPPVLIVDKQRDASGDRA